MIMSNSTYNQLTANLELLKLTQMKLHLDEIRDFVTTNGLSFTEGLLKLSSYEVDFYVLPHYLTAPFKKVTEKIMTEFSDLNLCPINNRQGIVIDGEDSKVICKD